MGTEQDSDNQTNSINHTMNGTDVTVQTMDETATIFRTMNGIDLTVHTMDETEINIHSTDDTDAGFQDIVVASSPSGENEFSSRKTVAHAMMDAALLMANISQLRIVLGGGDNVTYFRPLLCLILFSIFCQVLFAILILGIWARNQTLFFRNPPDSRASDNDYWQKRILRSDTVTGSRSPGGVRGVSKSLDYTDSSFHGLTSRAVATSEKDHETKPDIVTERIHWVTVVTVFVITVTNMFITGLGFDSVNPSVS